VKIAYDNPLHKKVLGMILDRYKFSERAMSQHYARWKQNEEMMQAYVPADEAAKIQAEKEIKVFRVKIPYAYAILQTYTTYASTVFLGRDPIIQVAASSGQTRTNEMAVEAILGYQFNNNGSKPHLFSWINDTACYGFSCKAVYWDEDKGYSSQWVEEPKTLLGIPTGGTTKRLEKKEMSLYSGNKWQTLSPYCVFPDPRVSMVDYQKGEFFGVETYPGWHTIAARYSIYQNLNEAKVTKFPTDKNRQSMYSSFKTPETDASSYSDLKNSVDNKKVLRMSVEIIPRDWGLGDSGVPEKWLFEVVNDAVIIYAEPLGEMHSMHPFTVSTYEIDTASIAPRGLMDILRDSSMVMNWLFDTHIYNVRKAINNMFVVDPAKINIEDLRKGDAGRLIRIKPAYQGQGVQNAIEQLQVHDVTQQHLQDMKVMMDLMHKLTGINDNLMGQLHQGRKSATEIRTASSSGANRLQTQCRWMSAVGWEKFSRMLISNTQQYMTDEQKFRIAGGIMESGDYTVSPEDIVGFYTYVPVDGTLPIDRMAMAGVWQGFLKEAMMMPQFAQKYDMVRIMAYLANLGGIMNLKQFEMDPMSQPAINQQVQAGNLVPAKEVVPSGPKS
jgi:hypothetical protein